MLMKYYPVFFPLHFILIGQFYHVHFLCTLGEKLSVISFITEIIELFDIFGW